MAVDTASKRYSMINFGVGDQLYQVPVNGVDEGDRLNHLSLYSGLGAEAPASSGVGQMMMAGLGV